MQAPRALSHICRVTDWRVVEKAAASSGGGGFIGGKLAEIRMRFASVEDAMREIPPLRFPLVIEPPW